MGGLGFLREEEVEDDKREKKLFSLRKRFQKFAANSRLLRVKDAC